MVTNEERRELAKKIRELAEDVWSLAREWEEEGIFTNGQDQADYYQIYSAIFGTLPAEHMHPCDYNELHERLADLIEPERELTCKWVWHEEWDDTPGGRECVCANWELDCGCWDWSDEELSCFDNIESSPNNGWKVCPRCGAKVIDDANE